jgi:hypothetical protein
MHNDLVIMEIGGVDPVLVRPLSVNADWQLSAPGTLTALLSHDEARRAHMFGHASWVYWEHPTAGGWGGVVGDLTWTPAGLKVPCAGFGVLLGDRIAPLSYASEHIPPGAHLRKLFAEMEVVDGPHYYTKLEIDEDGEPQDLDTRYENILESILPDLTEQGHEWRVRCPTIDDRIFEFRRTIGDDVTGGPALVEGRHIVDWSYTENRSRIKNDYIAVGGSGERWKGLAVRQYSPESIATWGLQQHVLVYARQVTRHTRRIIRGRVRHRLRRQLKPLTTLTFTLVDEDGCFAWFREGDTVRIILPTPGLDVAVRVGVRSLGADGRMQTGGEVIT